MTTEHLILLPDCTEAKLDMAECAERLCSDFGELVIKQMGGHSRMIDMSSSWFPGSRIRLLGNDGILQYVLLKIRKGQVLTEKDNRAIVKLSNATARGMGIRLPIPPSKMCLRSDFDQLFAGIDCTRDDDDDNNNNKFDFNHLSARKMPSGISYIDLCFETLVKEKAGEELSSDVIGSILQSNNNTMELDEDELALSSREICGVRIDDLIYDDAASTILHTIFGPGMPDSDTRARKNLSCINPAHDDRNPSMSLWLRPMFWRNSEKIKRNMDAEEDRALENMYRSSNCSSDSRFFARVSDNCVRSKKNGRIILLYVCTVKCYTSFCNYSKPLKNEQIKQSLS